MRMGDPQVCKESSSLDSIQDARVAFRESYIHRLVPVLARINEQGSGLTMCERLRAVRFAADMSLVLTADGVNWSHALGRQLNLQLCKSENDSCSTDHSSTVNEPPHTKATSQQSKVDLEKQEKTSMAGTITLSTKPIHKITNVKGRKPIVKQPHRRHFKSDQSHFVLKRLRKRTLAKRFSKIAWKRTYMKVLRSRLPQCAHERETAAHTIEVPADSQIKSLQKIIPGGSEMMDAGVLLKEAADYILSLQMQVEALETLTEAVHRSNRS